MEYSVEAYIINKLEELEIRYAGGSLGQFKDSSSPLYNPRLYFATAHLPLLKQTLSLPLQQ